jgi:filamentous hemagglutinin family protein
MIARWPLLLTRLSLVLGSPVALAQIVTDGTVGPATRLSGPEMTIGAELGSTRGANLFHSFQRFDIPTGQRATFTGPDQIQNVIGRVTGGQTSQIDGTLRSTVGQADVYLINPSGVVMGPNARVDVPAALHLSTADELRFSDGSRYSARDPANSTLTLAAPESFGFLSPQPAPLNVESSQLELKPGQTATLTAGDVSITGTAERRATLSVPGGEIRIEAVGDQGGQVSVIMPTEQPGRGRLSIEQARIETSGDGGGRLSVRAGEASLTQATLATDNRGQQDAANGIDMSVASDLRLWAGILQSKAVAGGRSGDVTITAGALTMFDGAYVETTSYGAGQAGDIAIRAGELLVDGWGNADTGLWSEAYGMTGDGGRITVDIEGFMGLTGGAQIAGRTFTAGAAGHVAISAGLLRLDGAAIRTLAHENSTGGAGDITVSVTGSLALLNGAAINASTAGQGDAGLIAIKAADMLMDGTTTGADPASILAVANRTSTGRAGNIVLEVAELACLTNEARVSTSSYGSGDAGQIGLKAGRLYLQQGGQITNDTFLGGDGGNIGVSVNDLLIDGGQITSRVGPRSSGRGGEIHVEAADSLVVMNTDLQLQRIAQIATTSYGAGDAGRVSVRAGALELLNGAEISADTAGAGDAGTVVVSADSLRIDGQGQVTGITSELTRLNELAVPESVVSATRSLTIRPDELASGRRGQRVGQNVTVEVAGSLELLGGGRISNNTHTASDAGTLLVRAGDLSIDGRGAANLFTGILSQTSASGRGGQLSVEVSGLLELTGDADISSDTYGSGAAGHLLVTADRLRLSNGSEISSDTLGAGPAGSVSVRTNALRIEALGSQGFTGISTAATEVSSAGAGAGDLDLRVAGSMELVGPVSVSSSTWSAGKAGDLSIQADTLSLRDGAGINSGASDDPRATGQAGSIRIQAGALRLDGGAGLASSAGSGGGDAGHMTVEVSRAVELQGGATITTASKGGDAGTIAISGGRLWLTDGHISTSAQGATGDGGDIVLRPDYLILDGGFIQANTAAVGARGGDILIDSRALVASESLVEIGGAVRQDFAVSRGRNIIQAAAPGGEQGTIDVTSPDLDITAALVPLATVFDDPDDLLTDLCRGVTGAAASSLVERGAGGLPPTRFEPAAVSFVGTRLDRLNTP